MDFPQQWNTLAPLPAGWTTGMPFSWFPYSGMPFDPFGLQPQQPSNLTELQPLQPFTAPPTPPDYPASPESEDSPASPTTSFSNSYEPVAPQLYDKPVEAQLTPPSSDDGSSDGPRDSPTPNQTVGWNGDNEATPTGQSTEETETVTPSLETDKEKKKQAKRGQKRKRVADEEDECKRSAVSHLSNPAIQNPYPATFWKVVGRFAVVGHSTTYNVTSDEIHRRTSFPECLNRSHLGPLLRRGKIKGCGDDLQQLLENVGLSSNQTINRKKFPLNTLNAFLEEEAVQFSADHRDIAFKHFPMEAIARLIIRGIATPKELGAAAAEVKIAKSTMDTLLPLFEEWTDGGWTTGTSTILESPLRSFALATHGLGVEEARLFFSLYARFLVILDVECDAHLARVSAAFHSDMYAMVNNQFPANLELPFIPPGYLHKPDIAEDAQGSSSFAEISGRLTLNNRKYNVTVAEILRRVRAPESLNLSILGSQLRKGKTKDNGNALRVELDKYGITIDQGRRKLARITSFTSILEGEALVVAADMEQATKNTFPFVQLAEALVARAGVTHPQEIQAARTGFYAAGRIAESLGEAVLSMRLPVAERIPHKVAQNAYLMLPYCNLTHGYGPDAAVSWIGHISNLFDVAAETLPMI